MFRGGDYIDDPGFNDLKMRPGYNYMDVTDINTTDKYGNKQGSPSHQKYKLKRDKEYIRNGGHSPSNMSPSHSPQLGNSFFGESGP